VPENGTNVPFDFTEEGQHNKSNKLRKLSVIDKTLNNNDINNKPYRKTNEESHTTNNIKYSYKLSKIFENW
jgi:hypothetical protein